MGSFSPLVLFWYIFPAIVIFGCQFLVKIFALTRRFKVKAPDLAVPFCGEASMHCLVIPIRLHFCPFIDHYPLMAICIALFQAYYYDELVYSRYFKMTWRLTFW
ncbi:DUF3397 family protein [Enterococcus mundtii]|nr:DUF3397 family protein [Enterococcus mundtii]